MKPFTFLLVVLGLILGFAPAGSRTYVMIPPQPPLTPVLYQALPPLQAPPPLAARAYGSDDEDDREEVEGLPVPIVPGTRVTEAKILPPEADPAMIVSPRRVTTTTEARAPSRVALAAPTTIRAISGRLSATVERARDDARLQLEREVMDWLTPEVSTQWKPPGHLITQMIRKTEVHPLVRDYGTVYETTLEADFGTPRRDDLVAAYQREVVAHRLVILAGTLGFVLVCLGALAGYIRADEATKGYYTHWLRAVAAAGVGASGVALYQILT